ncbi:uncharacterized protein TRAVEDRAFT_30925 [Trametes versicolor FP-101664 SS1]|uniref:uncharacterized protein n=1 Tax=Trametes versicolor (strain FP-101664) TaxID=717944 RepID=UPI000462131B|nr:uncharacterized protein TRAVEDRAFT_30925 [Trametes versicolor FP-101664 SS1]EIW55010.1 hypothetical protein TRAVEDRAFT_30925 [Trametes versicolor FP-101664 SS1]
MDDEDEDVLMADADAVAQEDGYESPSPSLAQEDGYESPSPSLAQWDSPDISSPVRPKAGEWGDDFDAEDILSSPPLPRNQRPSRSAGSVVTVERAITRALPLVPLRAPLFGGRTTKSAGSTSHAHSNSTSFRKQDGRGRSAAAREPDLRDAFDDWDEEVTSGGEDFAECEDGDGPGSTASSTPGPVTPADADADTLAYEDEWRYAHGGAVRVMGGVGVGGEDVRAREAAAAAEGSSEELEEDPLEEVGAGVARDANARVARGWREKWACSHSGPGGSRGQGGGVGVRGNGVGGGGQGGGASGGNDRKQQQTPLRRRETTMTPDGRQRPPGRAVVRSAPQVAKRASLPSFDGEELRAVGRTRLTFITDDVATPKTKAKPKAAAAAAARPGSADGTGAAARKRLEHFRWTPACR